MHGNSALATKIIQAFGSTPFKISDDTIRYSVTEYYPSIHTCGSSSSGKKGGFFKFDKENDPERVFSQFFGTNNPYEALEGNAPTSRHAALHLQFTKQ